MKLRNNHKHEAPDGDPTHFECETCDYLGVAFCGYCHKLSDDVDTRYSFGVYAGRMCIDCCSGYQDNCGIGQPQGTVAEYEGQYYEE